MNDDHPKYEQWEPPGFDPGTDELSAHVGRQEDRDIIRDPEFNQPPTITRVGNQPPQPVNVELDRSVNDPSAAPEVTRVELRGHLERQPASTDRFGEAEQGRAGFVDDGDDR